MLVHPFTIALCSKCCISKTAASIGMFDTPLESLLNGPIGGKFFHADVQ